MQARFETPTKARSTGHTPKPLIVGDRAAIAAAVNEYISTPEKPILTPDKRTYGGLNGVQTMHHLHPCSITSNFQQSGYTGVKHPIFDLTEGPYNNHSGATTVAESKEKNSNLSEPSLRGHIDPFIVGNGSKNRFFAVTKNSDGFETLSPCASNSDSSAKTVKSPAGIALPSSPAYNAKGDNNEISGENAQSFYTPESCIFVANLPMAYSDHQLQKEIQLMYGAFGECYVKVRRDSQGMPYAFVQYTKPTSAEDAIEKGGNMLVGGRACRVEPAKVPRTVFLFKANGNALSVEQAKEYLQKFGPVQKAWTPSDTEQEMFGLPSGVFVRFMYYDHCQEALEKTRNEKNFHLQRKDDLAKTSSSRAFPRTSHVDHNGSHHGSNAIWIGSIQGDWASAQVLKNFYGRRVGSVSGAFVGAGSFGEKQSKYALVWFHERNAVSKAVECDTSELNVFNGGVPLRVQRKRSKPQTPEKRMGHVQSSPDDSFMRSPFNGGPVHHPMFMSPNMTPDNGRNFGFIHPMFHAVHPAYQAMQSPGLPYPSFNGHFPVQPNGLPGGFSPNNFSTPNESPTTRGFQNGFENLAMPRSESIPLYNGYLDRRF